MPVIVVKTIGKRKDNMLDEEHSDDVSTDLEDTTLLATTERDGEVTDDEAGEVEEGTEAEMGEEINMGDTIEKGAEDDPNKNHGRELKKCL
jgi:hypothetical protein